MDPYRDDDHALRGLVTKMLDERLRDTKHEWDEWARIAIQKHAERIRQNRQAVLLTAFFSLCVVTLAAALCYSRYLDASSHEGRCRDACDGQVAQVHDGECLCVSGAEAFTSQLDHALGD